MASDEPLIVVLDRDGFPGHIVIRPPAAPHRWVEYPRTPLSEVAGRIADATVVVTNKAEVRAEALAAAPRLGLIAVAATGMDNVDVAAAAERGVLVRNVVGYGTTSVAEHAMMLMLALARRLEPHRAAVLDGTWSESGQFCVFPAPIRDLAGLRLGLIGSGAIAGALAERARAFGMEVVSAERRGAPARPGRLPFEAVLASCDVISLHCPLTAETRGLLDARAFAAMKPGMVVINTARGALVDEAALEAALEAGIVAGAGLDVTLAEPPPAGAPILRLVARPDVIVTPHVAWASAAAMQTLADQVTANIQQFLEARSA
ncbi:MAG: D-2-hydroxyacid dehydrogenase [Caulobacteraceae bacterium]|nr:D-2-hydroxyacid dehydrogenase [Caulobacteraceae bacterium]